MKSKFISKMMGVVITVATVAALAIVPATPAIADTWDVDHLLVVASSTNFQAGTAITVTVTAKTAGNATVTDFVGLVELTSNDGQAVLPAPHEYVTGEAGVYVFTGVILKTKTTTGTITATNLLGTGTGTVSNITVNPKPLHHIATDPLSGTVAVGQTITFNAIGQDEYNNAVSPAITPATIRWSWLGTAPQGSINALTGVFTAGNVVGIYTGQIAVSANQTIGETQYPGTGAGEAVVADAVADISLIPAYTGAMDNLLVNSVFPVDILVEPNGTPINAIDCYINYTSSYFQLVNSSGTAITVGNAAATANTTALSNVLTNTLGSLGQINFSIGTSLETPQRPTTAFRIGRVWFKALAASAGKSGPYLSFNTAEGSRKTKLVYAGATWTRNTPSTTVTVYTTPVAKFTSNRQAISAGENVTFTDTSTGPASSWFWTFGDGATSTLQSPLHVYTQTGSFNVNLRITNVVGTNNVTNYSAAGPIVVQPGALDHLTVTGTGSMTAGTGNQLTIRAWDAFNNLLSSGTNVYTDNKTLIFAGPAPSPYGVPATVSDNTSADKVVGLPTNVGFTNGVSTDGGLLKAYNVGTHVDVTDTATGKSSTGNAAWGLNLTVTANTATHLKVTGTGTMAAGNTNQLTVTAYDSYGNVDASYQGLKNLTFTGPTVSTYGNMPNVEGTAIGSAGSFNFTAGATAATIATLTAYKVETVEVDVTDSTIASTANTSWDLNLMVTPANASHLKVTGTATMTAGNTNQLTVTAFDPYGNTDTNYTGAKLIVYSGPGVSPGGNEPTVTTWAGVNRTVGVVTTNITFTSGVSTAGGLLTAYKAETVLVGAADNVSGISSSANNSWKLNLTVNPNVLDSVTINQNNQEVAILQTFTFTATANDTYENTIPYGSYTRLWICDNVTAGTFNTSPGDNVTGLFKAGTIRATFPNAIRVVATQDEITKQDTATMQVIGGIVHGTVILDGGERTLAGHNVSLLIKLFATGQDVWSATSTANYTYTGTASPAPPAGGNAITIFSANVSNHTLSFDLVGVVPGIYDITISSDHTLMNVKRSVTVTPPEQNLSFGTLKEGNCNNDRQVNSLDFSTLATTYNKSTGDAGWDATADFDESGQVNGLDFSLLAGNYFIYYAPVELG